MSRKALQAGRRMVAGTLLAGASCLVESEADPGNQRELGLAPPTTSEAAFHSPMD